MQQILIIDDAKSIHTLVDSILTREHVTMQHAFDGESGLTLAESLRPALILLDVDMPGIDGYETCRRIKANPNLFACPVIFLTSQSTTEQKVRGLEMGAMDYITKPFSPPELLARVRASLRASKAIKMLEEQSLIDFLTGLGNRALFKQRLAAEVSLRIRTQKPLACIVVDVDNFQAINDSEGHPFADHVLQEIAKVLSKEIRIEDVGCRLGGDVFVVIAPNTETEDVSQLAERVGRELNKLEFRNQDRVVTVKCSVAAAPSMDTYDRTMFERATAEIEHSRQAGPACAPADDGKIIAIKAVA